MPKEIEGVMYYTEHEHKSIMRETCESFKKERDHDIAIVNEARQKAGAVAKGWEVRYWSAMMMVDTLFTMIKEKNGL